MSLFRTRVDQTRAKIQKAGRILAADAALVLTDTDNVILLNSTTGTKVATFNWTETTTAYGGTQIDIVCIIRSGGAYTIACTYLGSAGTLTIDAALESPRLIRIGSTLHCIGLGGATFA